MEVPIFWIVIVGLFCLAVIIGDYCQARDRELMRKRAKERHLEFLKSPEGRAKMREMDRVIRKHQERTGQIKEQNSWQR